MPSSEDIENQKRLLLQYRRTLSIYLQQSAMLGSAHAPPSVLNGIHEARDSIRQLKLTLRNWNIDVEDLPNDDDLQNKQFNNPEAVMIASAQQIASKLSMKSSFIVVVDPLGRGDYVRISEAIQAVSAGTCINVLPGLYEESISVEKPLEIIGIGGFGEIVIHSSENSTVICQTTFARLANIAIRCDRNNGENSHHCVAILQGRVEIEACDLCNLNKAPCVIIQENADICLRKSFIHGCRGDAVLFSGGRGLLENNDISGNSGRGIDISLTNSVNIKSNTIHNNGKDGIFVNTSGDVIIDGNDISCNSDQGVENFWGGAAIIRNNNIHDNKHCGVRFLQGGDGLVENNEIYRNENCGIRIMSRGNARIRNNKIHSNDNAGIVTSYRGEAEIEDNKIFSNNGYGIEVTDGGSKVNVTHNYINRNTKYAVIVHHDAEGVFDNNDLTNNIEGAWFIETRRDNQVKRRNNIE